MSAIEKLVDDHFLSLGEGVDPRIDVGELNMGLFHAGKMVETIFDQCIGQTDALDADSIAASARCLLALLGRLGGLVDALQEFTDQNCHGLASGTVGHA